MSVNIFHAVILGIVQGITEFLPISSTGHLLLVQKLAGWHFANAYTFDAALHIGTLIALLSYFWRDWIELLRPLTNVITKKPHPASPRFGRNLFWGIIIGCIPAGIAGMLINSKMDAIVDDPSKTLTVMTVIASALVVVGLLMWVADKYGSKRKRKLAQMNFVDWVMIGLAQACALIPGVSRSGATISAGLGRGLERDAAARFSFLLSTPIFIGMTALKLKDILEVSPSELRALAAPLLVGIVTSAVVGYLVIKFLLNYLSKHNVNVFVWYRVVFGALLLAMIAGGVFGR